jgi:hypothetical protein
MADSHGNSKTTKLPIRFATPQEDAANLPNTEVHDYSSALPEDNEPGRMNKPAPAGAHISDKVYLFPESYNALRREMHDNWPIVFKQVGWYMVFDAVTFIEQMDFICDTKTTFDTQKVSSICHKYLNILRKKRGVGPVNYDTGNLILNPSTGSEFTPAEIERLAQKELANAANTNRASADGARTGQTHSQGASDSSNGSGDSSGTGQQDSSPAEGGTPES